MRSCCDATRIRTSDSNLSQLHRMHWMRHICGKTLGLVGARGTHQRSTLSLFPH